MKPSANKHRSKDGHTNGGTNGQTNGSMDRHTNGVMNGHTNGSFDGHGNEIMKTSPEQQEFQLLVEALMDRTGQPRAEVEQWVNGAAKMLRGGVTFYDVSRSIGSFIASRARQAKPYMVSFGRSLLQSFAEEQRRLEAARLPAFDGGSPEPGPTAAREKQLKLRTRTVRRSKSPVTGKRSEPHNNPWGSPSALKQESIMIFPIAENSVME